MFVEERGSGSLVSFSEIINKKKNLIYCDLGPLKDLIFVYHLLSFQEGLIYFNMVKIFQFNFFLCLSDFQ